MFNAPKSNRYNVVYLRKKLKKLSGKLNNVISIVNSFENELDTSHLITNILTVNNSTEFLGEITSDTPDNSFVTKKICR